MNRLKIKKLPLTEVHACEVPRLLEKAELEYHRVDCVDWEEEFPYKPDMCFAIAQTDSAILVHYKVREKCVRAVADSDNGHVWEDSCCEFFVDPASDGTYYNFECNCAGKLLIGFGKDRNNRELAPHQILAQVDRISSLGNGVFDNREGDIEWDMALVIPFTAFFKHEIKSLSGKLVKGNFYKCGDKTTTPHFLSWNKINVPKPDFHLPEFFGELQF